VAASKKNACYAAHSLAEVYSAMTRLPGRHRLSGDQVLLFLQPIEERLTPVSLDAEEYSSTIKDAAAAKIVAGMVYDALLARCALKAKAETILTWNVQHFQRIGPEIAKRISTP
jgi:predicted nucleic acid-binding protein